ncbi:MAG: hypothetical protein HC859_11735 [Bacteroidia bacterium]|nr:hypothetical protein [Bacteroidia bacterium]
MKKALRQYRQSFKSKLVINVATLVAASILVVSVISYYQVRTSIRASASDHLTSILQGKKAAIETHFKHVTEQLVSFAANPAMADASKEFARAFAQIRTDSSGLVPYHIALGSMKKFYINDFLPELAKNSFYRTNTNYFPADSVTHILQHGYISENPNPYGSKQNLDAAMDGTAYSSVHANFIR